MTRHPSRTRSVNRVLRGLRKTHRIDSRTFGLARTGEEIGASAQHPVPTGETTDGVRRDVSYVSLPRQGPPPLRLSNFDRSRRIEQPDRRVLRREAVREVMVSPVDERHVDRDPLQRPRRAKSPNPPPTITTSCFRAACLAQSVAPNPLRPAGRPGNCLTESRQMELGFHMPSG